MEALKPWVALLDEDEDEHLFWQHGFQRWATHLELQCFGSVPSFLSASSFGKTNLAALMMGGVVPRGEETKWLSTLLVHPSCEKACIIMLSAELEENRHRKYLELGATDHLIKPASMDELKESVFTVSRHVAARQFP